MPALASGSSGATSQPTAEIIDRVSRYTARKRAGQGSCGPWGKGPGVSATPPSLPASAETGQTPSRWGRHGSCRPLATQLPSYPCPAALAAGTSVPPPALTCLRPQRPQRPPRPPVPTRRRRRRCRRPAVDLETDELLRHGLSRRARAPAAKPGKRKSGGAELPPGGTRGWAGVVRGAAAQERCRVRLTAWR